MMKLEGMRPKAAVAVAADAFADTAQNPKVKIGA